MTADTVGGVWTYALDLSRGLSTRGVETVLAILGPGPGADQLARAASIPGLTLLPTGLPLDWLAADAAETMKAGAVIAALARETGAELVHLNSPALAAGNTFPVPLVGACHSCLATWWDAVRGGPLPPDFAWRTELLRRGYAACDALAAPSRAFADATARAYDLPLPPAAVHNGRDPLPRVDNPPADLLTDFALTAGRLWDTGKNMATLDRAAARLGLPVLAAGPVEGPEGSRVALKHAHAVGRLDEAALAALLQAAPIYVSPAYYEPFGLAVLEAAQFGCALVLSDIPSFRELWDGAALFVAAGDDAGLADAIARLETDREERARQGALARARARRYTVDAMADAMLDLYRPLLRGIRPETVAA
ncbi:glycosyltransferase family 4 protein [Muricoccus radiodurans]|uniref:glycosyltransferase family 4 protein n=1 Tax=Muricoccus radiodurans TaxID=2231721 RepID=UPI003CEDFAB8